MFSTDKEMPGKIIKLLLKIRKRTQTEFADTLGYAGQGALTNKLKGGIPTGDFAKMLDMLGYDIIICDRESGEQVKFEDAEERFRNQLEEMKILKKKAIEEKI